MLEESHSLHNNYTYTTNDVKSTSASEPTIPPHPSLSTKTKRKEHLSNFTQPQLVDALVLTQYESAKYKKALDKVQSRVAELALQQHSGLPGTTSRRRHGHRDAHGHGHGHGHARNQSLPVAHPASVTSDRTLNQFLAQWKQLQEEKALRIERQIEIRGYQTQLSSAQEEIYRMQAHLHRLQQQKEEAESSERRAKEKARDVVGLAMRERERMEGFRSGWQEGYRMAGGGEDDASRLMSMMPPLPQPTGLSAVDVGQQQHQQEQQQAPAEPRPTSRTYPSPFSSVHGPSPKPPPPRNIPRGPPPAASAYYQQGMPAPAPAWHTEAKRYQLSDPPLPPPSQSQLPSSQPQPQPGPSHRTTTTKQPGVELFSIPIPSASELNTPYGASPYPAFPVAQKTTIVGGLTRKLTAPWRKFARRGSSQSQPYSQSHSAENHVPDHHDGGAETNDEHLPNPHGESSHGHADSQHIGAGPSMPVPTLDSDPRRSTPGSLEGGHPSTDPTNKDPAANLWLRRSLAPGGSRSPTPNRQQEAEEQRRREAEAEQSARRQAEDVERLRVMEEQRIRAEQERVREVAEQRRREEEEQRRREEEEEAEQRRREEEEEMRRREEEERRRREEEERRRQAQLEMQRVKERERKMSQRFADGLRYSDPHQAETWRREGQSSTVTNPRSGPPPRWLPQNLTSPAPLAQNSLPPIAMAGQSGQPLTRDQQKQQLQQTLLSPEDPTRTTSMASSGSSSYGVSIVPPSRSASYSNSHKRSQSLRSPSVGGEHPAPRRHPRGPEPQPLDPNYLTPKSMPLQTLPQPEPMQDRRTSSGSRSHHRASSQMQYDPPNMNRPKSSGERSQGRQRASSVSHTYSQGGGGYTFPPSPRTNGNGGNGADTPTEPSSPVEEKPQWSWPTPDPSAASPSVVGMNGGGMVGSGKGKGKGKEREAGSTRPWKTIENSPVPIHYPDGSVVQPTTPRDSRRMSTQQKTAQPTPMSMSNQPPSHGGDTRGALSPSGALSPLLSPHLVTTNPEPTLSRQGSLSSLRSKGNYGSFDPTTYEDPSAWGPPPPLPPKSPHMHRRALSTSAGHDNLGGGRGYPQYSGTHSRGNSAHSADFPSSPRPPQPLVSALKSPANASRTSLQSTGSKVRILLDSPPRSANRAPSLAGSGVYPGSGVFSGSGVYSGSGGNGAPRPGSRASSATAGRMPEYTGVGPFPRGFKPYARVPGT